MRLLASATISTAVAKTQKKDMECGWDNRARKQIRARCTFPVERNVDRVGLQGPAGPGSKSG